MYRDYGNICIEDYIPARTQRILFRGHLRYQDFERNERVPSYRFVESTANYFALLLARKFVKVYSITRNTNCKVGVFFGMLARVDQSLAVYRIELELMSAEVDERLAA